MSRHGPVTVRDLVPGSSFWVFISHNSSPTGWRELRRDPPRVKAKVRGITTTGTVMYGLEAAPGDYQMPVSDFLALVNAWGQEE